MLNYYDSLWFMQIVTIIKQWWIKNSVTLSFCGYESLRVPLKLTLLFILYWNLYSVCTADMQELCAVRSHYETFFLNGSWCHKFGIYDTHCEASYDHPEIRHCRCLEDCRFFEGPVMAGCLERTSQCFRMTIVPYTIVFPPVWTVAKMLENKSLRRIILCCVFGMPS